jgi:dihydroflavonol-4-reductase
MAAIAYGHNKQLCSPEDWTDTTKNVGAYVKSKTIAKLPGILFIVIMNILFQ